LKLTITGQEGFIGYHLYNSILHNENNIKLVEFKKSFFQDQSKLDSILETVDLIIHLAGVNRADDQDYLYEQNLSLSKKIIESIKRVNFKGKLIFASSILEDNDIAYGQAKREARELLYNASIKNNFSFYGLIIPNVFGPFCKPNYNSFISTFCNNLITSKEIIIKEDKQVKLVFINNLVHKILKIINERPSEYILINEDFSTTVSDVNKKLKIFYENYFIDNQIPEFETDFEKNLFITFQSYIDQGTLTPKKNKLFVDERGSFSEIIRSSSEGQSSFSITKPGVTRGNHFHTRKIERFNVVKGKALIEIRKIGTELKSSFIISDEEPSFIDMKVWHTHNIKNIGETDLITFFWINEFYNEEDSDTFFEKV